jgi:hypothetical protein
MTRTVVSFQVWEKIIGAPVSYYDLPSRNAFVSLSDEILQLHEGDSISIISVASVSSSFALRGLERRQLAVNMSVASEFYFTLSAVMENYGYNDPNEFASTLKARLVSAYTSSSISGDYLSLCVQNGAEYLTLTTEILFTEPRFSNTQVEIVQTNSPTGVPAKENSRNENSFSNVVPPLYLYAIGGVIFLLILICSALIARNWQKSNRHLPTREAPVNTKDKEFDFDEVDFYSPSNLSDQKTPKSVLKNNQSEKQTKYREKLSSLGLHADEPATIEMKKMESSEHQSQGEVTGPEGGSDQAQKPRVSRITHISAGGSGGPKKKLSLSNVNNSPS